MRRNLKRWAVLFTVVALCAGMAAPMPALAAEKEVSVSDDANVLTTENVLNEVSPITVSTTQRCSVWSTPATIEENRVKYVDEGYQITVYPEVVASTLGDGKTFYRTIKGAYILCRCVDAADGSGAESGNGTVVIPSLTEVLEGLLADNDDRVVVRTARYDLDPDRGSWSIVEYGEGFSYIDSDGRGFYCEPMIRSTGYRANGTVGSITEYPDMIINEFGIPQRQYPKWMTLFYEDGRKELSWGYDALGNNIKDVRYHADGSISSIDIKDESGNRKNVNYNADGSVQSVYIRDASGGEWIKVL